MRQWSSKPETSQERMRVMWCDFCNIFTKFDTGRAWFHCDTCKRCYTCVKRRAERCEACINWEKQDEILERKMKRELKEEAKELKARDLMMPIVEEE